MNATLRIALLLFLSCCASIAAADSFGTGANTFDIEFVTIGNPGNPDDDVSTTSAFGGADFVGSVDYLYRIGKFEISEDMITKANTLGGLGITQFVRGANKPASAISWFEAAQFVNWLNTSTGARPAYKFDVAGNFQLWEPGDAGYDPNNLYRNSLARYFLPSVDEWHKAAYYDPIADVYYNYPTGSDTLPTPVSSGTAADTAVYGHKTASDGPADITMAGGLSPYGTMAQGGNVWEWEETDFDLVNDSTSSDRGSRGGSWASIPSGLHERIRFDVDPTSEFSSVGIRVASVPEPSTLVLACVGVVGGLIILAKGKRHTVKRSR